MPVLSRKVVVMRQKRHKQLKQLKRLQRTMNKSLLFVTTFAISNGVLSSRTIDAQTLTTSLASRTDFLNLISGQAKKIAAANDLFASVMVAQAILESGWGTSTLSQAPYYNLFGIKGSQAGQSVSLKTLEDNGTGSYYSTVESFKTYESYEGSLIDYANLLTGNGGSDVWRSNYYAGARRSQASTYQEATAFLTGRYATDSAYANKLNALIQQHQLTNLDQESSTTRQVSSSTVTQTSGGSSQVYVVQGGDTYWSLAKRFGISVSQLQALNNHTTTNLSIGQSLVVPQGATGVTTTTNVSTASNATTSSKVSTRTAASLEPNNASKTSNGTYTVQAGDTLWALSKRYGVSVEDLLAANGGSSTIRVGQSLVISAAQPRSTSAETSQATGIANASSASSASNRSGYAVGTQGTSSYQVTSGDTLYGIARQYQTSVAALMQLNGLGSSSLSIGQELIIPGQSTLVNQVESVAVSDQNSTVWTDQTVSQPVVNSEVETSNVSVPAQANQGQVYTVQAGDTLYSLANRLGVSLDQLLAANGGSTVLRIGQSLAY